MRVAVDTEDVPEGLYQDLQIEAEPPGLEVVEVVFDPLLDRGVAPPAVDLRPASNPLLDLVAEHVAGHEAPELLDEARTLGARTDEAHLASEHVDELWQLVETSPSQADAEGGAARIVSARPHGPGLGLRVHPHRSEL